MATVKSLKANVSSVNPSSLRFDSPAFKLLMVANIYVINLVDNIKLPSLIYAWILFSFRNIFKDFRVFVEYIIYVNQMCKGTFQLHVYFEYVIQ